MIFTQPLSFIREFVEELDQGIRQCVPNRQLSIAQRYWLSFCLMGILLSNPVCSAAFARVGLGGYSQAALSWRFWHSKLLWPLLRDQSTEEDPEGAVSAARDHRAVFRHASRRGHDLVPPGRSNRPRHPRQRPAAGQRASAKAVCRGPEVSRWGERSVSGRR